LKKCGFLLTAAKFAGRLAAVGTRDFFHGDIYIGEVKGMRKGNLIRISPKGRYISHENIDRPTACCSRCGALEYVDTLRNLPEVEMFARQYALAMIGKDVVPEPINESELMSQYGFGFKSVLCPECWSKVVVKPLL